MPQTEKNWLIEEVENMAKFTFRFVPLNVIERYI